MDQENIWFDKAIKSELKNIFIQLFGYSWDLNSEFYMKYDYAEDLWIQVQLKKGDRNRQYISVTYSKNYWVLSKNCKKKYVVCIMTKKRLFRQVWYLRMRKEKETMK